MTRAANVEHALERSVLVGEIGYKSVEHNAPQLDDYMTSSTHSQSRENSAKYALKVETAFGGANFERSKTTSKESKVSDSYELVFFTKADMEEARQSNAPPMPPLCAVSSRVGNITHTARGLLEVREPNQLGNRSNLVGLVIGPPAAGKSSTISSIIRAAAGNFGYTSPDAQRYNATLPDGMQIRIGDDDNLTEGTTTRFFDAYELPVGEILYQPLDGVSDEATEEQDGDSGKAKGKIVLHDTRGIAEVDDWGKVLVRWLVRRKGEEFEPRTDVFYADFTLLVFDFADMVEESGDGTDWRDVRRDTVGPYKEVCELLRRTMPSHPIIVVLTKHDVVEEKYPDSADALATAAKHAVKETLGDNIKAVEFVDNYVYNPEAQEEVNKMELNFTADPDGFLDFIEESKAKNERVLAVLREALNCVDGDAYNARMPEDMATDLDEYDD